MTTVVSDTSPINYLLQIQAIDILPKLFDEILIPPAVYQELCHPRAPAVVLEWIAALPSWAKVKQPTKIDTSLDLDAGEAEAISLAIELKIPAILIDEKLGRMAAERRHLVPVGTLNILDIADRRGIFDLEIGIERLQATSFHVRDAIMEELLERSRERKRKSSGQN